MDRLREAGVRRAGRRVVVRREVDRRAVDRAAGLRRAREVFVAAIAGDSNSGNTRNSGGFSPADHIGPIRAIRGFRGFSRRREGLRPP